METRFRKPLWKERLVHRFLPSTLRRPSRRLPPSRRECHPGGQRRTRVRPSEEERLSDPGWGDLRPTCVWRSRSETSPCGRSSRCSPGSLEEERGGQPSFLSHAGPDGESSVLTLRPQVADTTFPAPPSLTALNNKRVASCFVHLPLTFLPQKYSLTLIIFYCSFFFIYNTIHFLQVFLD